MQGGPRRIGALAITVSAVLALGAGNAHAEIIDLGETTDSLQRDLNSTTDSLRNGQLNVLPETQERLRETVDRVVDPLRSSQPEQPVPTTPTEPAPPETGPDPTTPEQGVDQQPSTPGTSQPGSGDDSGSGSGTGSPGGQDDDAGRGSDAGRGGAQSRTGEGSGSSAGSQAGDGVRGGKPGPEVERAGGGQPRLRDAIVSVIQALPSEVRVALVILTLLLIAALAYLARTWRRLVAAERRASTDRLTGLPNRTSAEDTLARMLALADRHERELAIALFDLDHFKQINDRYGHQAGDAVLRAVSEAANDTIRASDVAGRWGGEEFIVLLPDTGEEGAMHVTEKLRARIAELTLPEVPHGVSASFGVAVRSDGSRSESELISAADRALYAAKDSGRNRVVVETETTPRERRPQLAAV